MIERETLAAAARVAEVGAHRALASAGAAEEWLAARPDAEDPDLPDLPAVEAPKPPAAVSP